MFTSRICRPRERLCAICEFSAANGSVAHGSGPMTEAFVRNIQQFVGDEGVYLVASAKGQHSDVTQRFCGACPSVTAQSLSVKALKKVHFVRNERRPPPGRDSKGRSS